MTVDTGRLVANEETRSCACEFMLAFDPRANDHDDYQVGIIGSYGRLYIAVLHDPPGSTCSIPPDPGPFICLGCPCFPDAAASSTDWGSCWISGYLSGDKGPGEMASPAAIDLTIYDG